MIPTFLDAMNATIFDCWGQILAMMAKKVRQISKDNTSRSCATAVTDHSRLMQGIPHPSSSQKWWKTLLDVSCEKWSMTDQKSPKESKCLANTTGNPLYSNVQVDREVSQKVVNFCCGWDQVLPQNLPWCRWYTGHGVWVCQRKFWQGRNWKASRLSRFRDFLMWKKIVLWTFQEMFYNKRSYWSHITFRLCFFCHLLLRCFGKHRYFNSFGWRHRIGSCFRVCRQNGRRSGRSSALSSSWWKTWKRVVC